MEKSAIWLVGATGYTGQLIAKRLSFSNIKFVAVGRNLTKLYQLYSTDLNCDGFVEMDVLNDGDLNQLRGANIVINCVGPFNYFAKEILNKCVDFGLLYIDITGEQEIVKNSLLHLHVKAKRNNATIVHSMSFESALSDMLLNKAMKFNNLQGGSLLGLSFNTYYKLEGKAMSPGTRLTMKLQSQFAGYKLVSGELVEPNELIANEGFSMDPIAPYESVFVPYPETIFASLHPSIQFSSSHYLVEKGDNLHVFSGISKTNKVVLNEVEIINRHRAVNHIGPTEESRQNQRFELHSYLGNSEGWYFQKIIGNNMYEITADLVVTAVQSLLDIGIKEDRLMGFVTPSQCFDDEITWLETNSFCRIVESKWINKK